ncbi:MAG: radical SAM protein [Elusimicrobia bacterium]|nr:radical SAM protein [Elusimicrobiota bacterium]MBK7575691.1 radical SAM protein [Elusimicrobiota bacterium]MBK8126978.1 radical SAM protein [Elusimicrobiota bacterium]MBK8650678.1 radical SAM protein [Elusimicrobiota bacterium]MBK9429963.1 radical SAM protein [Elusimicrobiota bacterium]
MPNRPYLFLELTNSVCSICLKKVEAKVLLENDNVFLQKRCGDHGMERVLISTDPEYYAKTRRYIKQAEMPHRWNTPIRYGCPYDCGLCPDHEQHSCLTILEITDQCNLTCPTCYAASSPDRGPHRSLEQICRMLDAVVANEKEPDIVQISGGEPTLHPQFFDILDAAKKRPIRHLMVNTNGVRIANDPDFAKKLKTYAPGFEIYLQFDSRKADALVSLRGKELRDVREKALAQLNKHNISTTLVVTLKKGVNDNEIGDLLRYALEQPCVRGVTFQPIQEAGRLEGYNHEHNRLTLSEVRQRIIDQSSLFTAEDVIPVPCHPESLAMAYALKTAKGPIPLTRWVDPNDLLEGTSNTIVFEKDAALQRKFFSLFSTAHSPASAAESLKTLLCCLPQVDVPGEITYDNVFRVIVMQFMDAHSLDVRSVKKSCVHIVHPDGRIIPFDTYNIFYRDDNEMKLKKLQEARA